MAKRKEVVQVTTPVAEFKSGADTHRIYVLRDEFQKFRMPGCRDESSRAWDYGPSIIHECEGPHGINTVTSHPEDANVWRWLNALLGIAAWAMGDDKFRSQIPEDLKKYWNRDNQ